MNVTYLSGINGRIDHEKGIVRGVSLITEGQAKGHDLHIDSTTVKQLHDACLSQPSGRVKTKLNHKSGVDAVFGYLSDPRIEGPKLLADLHLLRSHKDYDQTIEQIREMPELIGLSVAFTGKPEVGPNGKKLARAKSIVSADLVAEPAANPTGMFERGDLISVEDGAEVDTTEKSKDMDPFKELQEQLAQLTQRFDAIDQRLDAQDDFLQSAFDPELQGEEEEGGEGADSLDLTQEDVQFRIDQLRGEGYNDDQIDQIVTGEINAYYDSIEGQVGDDAGTDGNQEVLPGSGGHGGQDQYGGDYGQGGEGEGGGEGELVGAGAEEAQGGELAQLRHAVTELQTRLAAADEEAAMAEITGGMNILRSKVDNLATRNEALQAENEAMHHALEVGSAETLGAGVPAKEILLGEGNFENTVQTLIAEGKTHGEAIQFAAKNDRLAHMDWLKRQGVLPQEFSIN